MSFSSGQLKPEISTRLLYLEDQDLREATATVVHCESSGRGDVVVLDQTPLYIRRGGQPSDTGRIVADSFEFSVRDLALNDAGQVEHIGDRRGASPKVGSIVTVSVDADSRETHSLWHTAGEAVIVAAKMAGFDGEVTGAIHYGPNQNRIEYQKALTREEADQLKLDIETHLSSLINDDTQIAIHNLTDRADVIAACGYWPEYVRDGQVIRVIQIRPDYTGRPCTGTQLHRTGQIGIVVIDKIKTKGGKTVVSYSCP
jgi:misacylated tRNA(Ala) deacylase